MPDDTAMEIVDATSPSVDVPQVIPDVLAAPDANLCFGTGILRACLTALPTNDVVLDRPLNTSIDCTQLETQPDGPDLCLIIARNVTVSGTVAATGARPLVLLATDILLVDGTLDVSSRHTPPTQVGAGSNIGSCVEAGRGGNDSGGGGGGAGGSFGTPGGAGGPGDDDDVSKGSPGIPGSPQMTLLIVRGGCNGGAGGGQLFGGSGDGGSGGAGGGAVYLIAGDRIRISGNVFASGAGGGASNTVAGARQGGGGGGSGGMVGLDAPTIEIARGGLVVANGGAGAGGGDISVGGWPGGDGTTFDWNFRAHAGSVASGEDGNGARGTAIGQSTNIDGEPNGSGGGGGAGGLGHVWTYGTLTPGAAISPAPTMH